MPTIFSCLSYLLLNVVFTTTVFSETMHPTATYTHSAGLDPEGVFTVYWTPDLEKKEVLFEFHVKTRGWFGFGWSHNGGMKGGDFFTAFVDEGRLVLEDRYAVGEFEPPIDNQQDWRLLYGRENGTHTIIRAARPFETCDSDDIPITNETMRLIYAWGDKDEVSYHGANRGTRSALLLIPFHKRKLDDDVRTWSPKFINSIPAGKDTVYHCQLLKFPLTVPVHFLGFDIVFGRNARQHLHHILVYECAKPKNRNDYQKVIGGGVFDCYTENMPEEAFGCQTYVLIWAIGSEGEMFPENVGLPLGELSPHPESYFMFEAHLDNPQPTHTVQVEWGVDIYYTTNLRPKVAGIMTFGVSLSYTFIVPPGREKYLVAGHCSPKCLDLLPPEGVNVFATFLHTHIAGQQIFMRHFRDGKELPPIDMDRNYDFNFQQSRRLSKEVKIMPGDTITTVCNYKTIGRKNITTFGLSTRDEMCNSHGYYYPRVHLTFCVSSPGQKEFLKDFNLTSLIDEVDYFDYNFNPKLKTGGDYKTYMSSLPWDKMDVPSINHKLFYGNHEIVCLNGQHRYNMGHETVRYPDATPYVEPKNAFCSSSSLSWNVKLLSSFLMLSLYFIVFN